MSLKRIPSLQTATTTEDVAPLASNCTVESCLRDFCEAVLLLLQTCQDDNRSVLADVIPGFLPALRDCCQQTAALRGELSQWDERSHQLIQLASLYGGNGSTDLVASLNRTKSLATRVVDSLDALLRSIDPAGNHQAVRESVGGSVVRSSEELESSELHQSERHLRDFCESLLELSHGGAESQSVLPQTLPSLVRMFRVCDPATFESLRAELRTSEVRAEKLLRLATQHCGSAANGLQQNVKRSQSRVGRVIDTFEALFLATEVFLATPAHPPKLRVSAAESADNSYASGTAQAVSEQSRARSQSFFQMAGRCYQRQDYEMADRLYSEALRLDPTLRLAYVHRGRIRLARRKVDAAIADFSQAIQLDPNDPSTLRWRGDALSLCERFREALADYERALLLFPNRYLVRYNRAVVLRQTGDLDQAKSEFEQLIQIRPQQAPLYLNKGLICLSQGEAEAAIELFRTALRYQPNCQEAIDRLTELGIEVSPIKPVEKQVAPITPKKVSAPRTSGIDDQTANTQELELPVSAPALPEDDSDDELAMSFLDTPPPLAAQDEPEKPQHRPTASLSDLANVSRPPVGRPATMEATPTPRERAAPFLDIADGSSSQSQDRSLSLSGKFEARCPCCDAISFIALDKLQAGKVLTCPHCDKFFTSEPSGRLVEVKKTSRGKWKVVPKRSSADWPWSPTQIAGVVGVAVLLLSLFFFIPPKATESAANDLALPKDLEPRARVFTVAWLKGDIRTMRRLTGDNRGSDLYMWCMENPTPLASVPPTLERDLQLKVEITKSVPPTTQLKIHMDGLQPVRGRSASDLQLAWKQEGETWVFQPFLSLEI